jgi:uncharacterized protein (TIGR00297 family)
MEPFGLQATLVAITVSILLSVRALKKKSLTIGGSISAFAVGFLHCITGLRGLNLLVFYQVGTIATKYKLQLKATKDGTVGSTAARGASQVLSCSILSTLLSLTHAMYCGEERPIDFASNPLASHLTCAILAHHATCLADTLASELGLLAKSSPVLITQPWRSVPSGTNGGVTLEGTLWTAVGGAIIGLSTVFLDYLSGLDTLDLRRMVLLGIFSGLIGSILDSILGASLQQSFWDDDKKLVYHAEGRPQLATLITGANILNNEQVNLVSTAIATALGGWVLGPIIFAR